MRRIKTTGRPGGRIGFNMTPMIDVVLLLIIFFMLASQFTSAERAPIEPPVPDQSLALPAKLPGKVTINILYAGEHELPILALGPVALGPIRETTLASLSSRLARRKTRQPDLQVLLRADRRVPYVFVRRVMYILAENGIELMNMAAREQPR